MFNPRLHVNIDHVATLRQARRTVEPSLLEFVKILEYTKASGITMHLREDRRHVNDQDIFEVNQYLFSSRSKLGLTFEMGATDEIRNVCLQTKAQLATIVPEKREELTTEGGLDLLSKSKFLQEFIKPIQANGTRISFFVDPNLEQIEVAKSVGADFIELHTGTYANLFVKYHSEQITPRILSDLINPINHLVEPVQQELDKLYKAAEFANSIGLQVNLGHGLTIYNLPPILQIPHIQELHIGHSIVSNSLYHGAKSVVDDFCSLIRMNNF